MAHGIGAGLISKPIRLIKMKDAEIIEEFLENNDPDLFRTLIERYEQKVFRLVVSVCVGGACLKV